MPGIAVADGETILAEGFGTRRLGRDQPVTADTVFAICSCTKAFTPLLLGMLVEEGVLDWDPPYVRSCQSSTCSIPSSGRA